MKIRTQAKNLALAELERIRDQSENEYNFRDAKPAVIDQLMALFVEDDQRLEDMLDEIVDAAVRDADRKMTEARDTTEVQIGQLPIFFDYDPRLTVVLGEQERIQLSKARREHLMRSERVETDNIVAQNQAFAKKREWRVALIDTMEPLDPRTTVDDIVHLPEADG